jgi:hypothetical protein
MIRKVNLKLFFIILWSKKTFLKNFFIARWWQVISVGLEYILWLIKILFYSHQKNSDWVLGATNFFSSLLKVKVKKTKKYLCPPLLNGKILPFFASNTKTANEAIGGFIYLYTFSLRPQDDFFNFVSNFFMTCFCLKIRVEVAWLLTRI